MKRHLLSLALTLVMCMGLSIPASANSMGKAGQENIVGAGGVHTGLIDKNGSLWMWGGNADGELGNGSTKNSSVPVKVLDNVVAVSCGETYTAAIKTDGSLWTWGDITNEVTGSISSTVPVKVLDNVVAVSCGYDHIAAIKTDGSLWTWGDNSWGELGNGGGGNQSYHGLGFYFQTVPIKVMDNVAAVSCGMGHTAAIKTDGSLWMWGDNCAGELGNGYVGNDKMDSDSVPYPIQNVPVKIMDNVESVNCGGTHTAAIKTDGSLWMWGSNADGELGNGYVGNETESTSDRNFPMQTVPAKLMDGVASVSCGSDYTAAVKTDGSLWMWGGNDSGELGNGHVGNKVGNGGGGDYPVQTVPVKLMDGVATVSCGDAHTMIIKTDGSVWACGLNNGGQLGNGGTSNGVGINGNPMQTTPVKLSFSTTSTASNVVKIDTGKTLTVKVGKTYQFKLTANSKPTFVSGNPKVFSVTYKGHTGNNYFYQVKAVGKVAQGTGFYLNGSKTPVTVGNIG